MKFSFATAECQHFCEEIVECLVRFGSLSTSEAVSLLNSHWADWPLDVNDLRLHENPYYWAMCILYAGEGGYDWTQDPARQRTPLDLCKRWYGNNT